MAETSKAPTALRRLGGLELFSSTRHYMGIYRTVVVTARYERAEGPDPAVAVAAALASVVRDQPALRVGIAGQDTSVATFSHVYEVDLRRHIEWRYSTARTLGAYEDEVSRTQGWLHDQLFEEIESRPPWRVVCFRPQLPSVADAVSPRGFVDILFSYHHALVDGTGGREFHQHLLAALNSAAGGKSMVADQHILSFPDPPRLPACQEEAVPFHNSYLFLMRAMWATMGPSFLQPRKDSVWGGAKMNFSLPYVTRVKPISITADAVQSFVAASRKHGCTLTTALHGVVLSSLAKRLPKGEADAFACSTPVSLRPWLRPAQAEGSSKDTLRVCLTTHVSNHPPALLQALRSPGADVDTLVWEAGRRIKAELKGLAATLPNDDAAGLLPLIKDFMAYWRQKDGKNRDSTWEISNIGIIAAAPGKTNDAPLGWRHISATFTSGAMVTGPVIGINVISVEGGPLTVALTWQEAAVSEELVEGLAVDIREFIDKVNRE